ncbi:hypothetical protein T492DRAFT_1093224 [Pavlovales sp. CCMP2436]|nr:hypothetical protein T492DRAFT_1093224 [Pavlovales sp. CCMP2436]
MASTSCLNDPRAAYRQWLQRLCAGESRQATIVREMRAARARRLMLARSFSTDGEDGSLLVLEESPRQGIMSDHRRKLRLHLGPVELSWDRGLRLKPKFCFGLQGGAFYAVLGVRDIRNGLAVEAWAMAYLSFAGVGSSLAEFLESVHAMDAVPVLDTLLSTVPHLLGLVLRLTGVDVEDAAHEVAGVVLVYVGAGVTAGIHLGYADRAGYHMLGVEGTVATGLGLGLTFRVGVHRDGMSMRLVLWVGNVGVDVTVSLKPDTMWRRRSESPQSPWLPVRQRSQATPGDPEQIPMLTADSV